MRLLGVVVVGALCCVLASSGWGETPTKAEAEAKDKAVEKQLDTVIVSFEFKDKPVMEAVEELARLGKVTITVEKGKTPAGAKITLKLKDVPLRTGIKLLTDQLALKFVVRDGAVLITDEEGVSGERVRVDYNVLDLMADADSKGPGESMNNLIALIKKTIAPGTWGEGSGNTITARGGTLIVVHNKEAHKAVEKLLAGLRKANDK